MDRRNSIVSYMETQALALHRVFEDNKVFGSVLESYQGPRVIVYRIKPHSFDHRTITRINGMSDMIKAALAVDSVRVQMVNGVVHIEVPSPWQVTVPANKISGSGYRVPIGVTGSVTHDGKLETVDVDFRHPTSPHLAVFGATGSGKTVAMQAICYHLARQNRHRVAFVVLAPQNKLARWGSITDWPQTVRGASDPSEIKDALRWAADVATQREPGRIPEWFIVIDDLLAISKMVDVKRELAVIAAQGREPGMHLIIGSQRSGESGAGGTEVTANIVTRLILSSASARDAAMLAGRGRSGAEELTGYGDAMLVAGGEQRRVFVAMASDSDLTTLFPRTNWQFYPWMKDVETKQGDPLEQLNNGGLPAGPLLKMAPPDEHGEEVIRRVYALTGKKTNKTLQIVFGGKNGKTLEWLHNAIGEVS